jgi:hypothetical protein
MIRASYIISAVVEDSVAVEVARHCSLQQSGSM